MKLPAGTAVLVTGGSLARGPRRGVVDVDYDGCGDVMVILAGKKKARPVDARRVRAEEPARDPLHDAIEKINDCLAERTPRTKHGLPPAPRTRVVPVPEGKAATLRAVPRPAPPARDASYLEYVRAEPCCSCGAREGVEAHHWARRGRSGGLGRKTDDYRTVPLCEACHRELHDTGTIPSLRRDDPACPECERQPTGVGATRLYLLAVQVDLLVAWVREGRKGR